MYTRDLQKHWHWILNRLSLLHNTFILNLTVHTAQKQWHYGTCEPPIALGGLSIGPKAGKCMLGYYANMTGIIVMNSTIQKQTSISICFENYLATSTASSDHYGITGLQNLAWQSLQAPNPISFSSQQHPHQLQTHEVQIWTEKGYWVTTVYPARRYCRSDQSSTLFLSNKRHEHVFRKQGWVSTASDFRWQCPCCCFVHQDVATSVSAVRSERLQAPAVR